MQFVAWYQKADFEALTAPANACITDFLIWVGSWSGRDSLQLSFLTRHSLTQK